MKLAINLPLLVAYQALGEAYTLARSSGMSADDIMELLADTSGAPMILKVRGPVIAAALKGAPPAVPAFDIDSIRKDLRTMLAEAAATGATLPVAAQALAVFDQAASDGWGSRDGTALPAYWAAKSGGR
jgi:3-hydroxyisobutyrate dehydrogenase